MRKYQVDDACLRDAEKLAEEIAFDGATICAALRMLKKRQNPDFRHRVCGTLTLKMAEALVAVDKLRAFLTEHDLFAVTLDEIRAEQERRLAGGAPAVEMAA